MQSSAQTTGVRNDRPRILTMISATTPQGRVLAFAPVLRPVVALKSGKTRGSLLDRLLREGGEEKPADAGLSRLTEYDVEQIDRNLLETGLTAIKVLHGQEPEKVLFVPAAFSTLASPRGRREILSLIDLAQTRLGARVILEVSHLDPGLPASRLVEVLAHIRPTCAGVFARMKPDRQAIKALADCTLAGVAIQASDLKSPEDEEFLTKIRLVMQTVGPRLILHNLRTVAAMNAAHAAGVSYASLDLTLMGGKMPDMPVSADEDGDEVAPAAA
jgi:hypothetical protein